MHPQLYLAAQRHLVRSLSCVARRLPCTDVRAFVKDFITVGPKNHFGKLQMFVVRVDLYVMWYMRRWFPSCLVEHLLDPAQDFIRFNSNNGSSMCRLSVVRKLYPEKLNLMQPERNERKQSLLASVRSPPFLRVVRPPAALVSLGGSAAEFCDLQPIQTHCEQG